MFWFWVALIFFLLWITKKPKHTSDNSTPKNSYDQGFWDGWRAFGKKVSSDLEQDTVSTERLQSYIRAGSTGVIPIDTAAPTASDVSDPVRHEAPATVDAIEPGAITSVQTDAAQPGIVSEPSILPEEKERITLKNLNTLLYVASFLIVAAAAAFIASSTPPAVRIILLWLVVGMFYGGGLWLYAKTTRLRPAAIAFTGTGLAVLPFAGLALTMLAGVPGQVAWWLTSLIGIFAYAIATVVLKQAVIAYMTLAFVLSLASSSANLLQLPLVWSFVAVMLVALVAHFIASLRPQLLPEVFRVSIKQTGEYVTPLALFASLFTITELSAREYTLIFAIASLQYCVYWMNERTYRNETIARILSLITLVILGFSLGNTSSSFQIWWCTGIVCLSAIYSLVRVRVSDYDSPRYESTWLALSITSLLIIVALWTSLRAHALEITITLELIILIAGIAALRLRRIEWGYVCLAGSIALPYAIGASLDGVHWYEYIYPWLFAAASLAALYHYYCSTKMEHSAQVQQFTATAFVSYATMATIAGLMLYLQPLSIWLAPVALILAVSYVLFSYMSKYLAAEFIAIPYLAGAIAAVVWNTSNVHTWHSLIITGILYLGLIVIGIIHHNRQESARATGIFGAGQLVIFGLSLGILQPETQLATMLLLLVASAGAALRYLISKSNTPLDKLYAISPLPYLLLAWVSSQSLAQGWHILLFGLAAIIYWALSYRAREPLVAIIANGAILGVVMTLCSILHTPPEWTPLLIGWVVSGIYGLWYAVSLLFNDSRRSWVHIISLWFMLTLAILISLGSEKPVALASCASLAILAVSVGLHGYIIRRSLYGDVFLFLLSAAIQIAIYIQWPETRAIIYGHLTAATFLGVALWRRRTFLPRSTHYLIAASALTLTGLITAFSDGGIYQLVFLVEHIVILIIGALKGWQRVIWWGVGASVAAILYFLRDYFFLWLAFLGIVLIAIVIWRLNSLNKPTDN